MLITSAINVAADQTALVDRDRRLALTLAAVEKWRLTPGIRDVVVCDGSGFDLSTLIRAMPAERHAARCEVLTFTNDVERVRCKGKGYGEGQIVNHALLYSEVLRAASNFAKCTGKLWVKNYLECARRYNGRASFDFAGIFYPRQIDTRFYMVNKQFFRENMSALHENVNDGSGVFLEHAFFDGLKSLKPSEYVMLPTPRIHGVSGTSGSTYEISLLRAVARDVRSFVVRMTR